MHQTIGHLGREPLIPEELKKGLREIQPVIKCCQGSLLDSSWRKSLNFLSKDARGAINLCRIRWAEGRDEKLKT